MIGSMLKEFAAAHFEEDPCEVADMSAAGVFEMVKLEGSAS